MPPEPEWKRAVSEWKRAVSEWQRAEAICRVLVAQLLREASPADVIALLLSNFTPPTLLSHLQRAQAILALRQGRAVVA